MNIMGIDIGTTSVSIVLIEKESGNLIARETAEHRSFLTGGTPEEKIQGGSIRSPKRRQKH